VSTPATVGEATGLRLVRSDQPTHQQTQEPATAREATGLRLVLVGWGAIARATARLLRDRGARVEIVAVAVRDPAKPRSGLPPEALVLTRPQELGQVEAEMVVEAAGRHTVVPWGRAALSEGVDFVVTSVSAFAEPGVLDDLTQLAVRAGAQIHVPPGALGGVDALAAASKIGIDTVEHHIIKPPLAWLGTPAEDLCDLHALTGAEAFFSCTAREAASRFPENANAALTTALAGTGPQTTRVTLIADPNAMVNRHEIRAEGQFGELSVVLRNKPLKENPKSSALTALNLARCIENRLNPVVI